MRGNKLFESVDKLFDEQLKEEMGKGVVNSKIKHSIRAELKEGFASSKGALYEEMSDVEKLKYSARALLREVKSLVEMAEGEETDADNYSSCMGDIKERVEKVDSIVVRMFAPKSEEVETITERFDATPYLDIASGLKDKVSELILKDLPGFDVKVDVDNFGSSDESTDHFTLRAEFKKAEEIKEADMAVEEPNRFESEEAKLKADSYSAK